MSKSRGINVVARHRFLCLCYSIAELYITRKSLQLVAAKVTLPYAPFKLSLLQAAMVVFGSGMCRSVARLDGKTAVITGANTGIGFETAREFLKRGARVVLACRNQEAAHAAADKLRSEVSNAQLRVIHLDLSSLDSVKTCGDELKRTEEKIHLLINNAGVMACPYIVTKDGLEMQFQTNHLGHFLLTKILLANIEAAAPSRIINVSSHAHYTGKINFEDLQSTESYSSVGAYNQSKLCNVLFTLELRRNLKDTGVVTYAVHPGVVATDLGRHLDSLLIPGCSWLFSKARWFIKSPWQGAQTTLHCALDESLARQEEALYFSDCRAMRPSSNARKKDDATRLWQVSDSLIAKHFGTEQQS